MPDTLNNTNAVVPCLLQLLPRRDNSKERYCVYLDNLFTSIPLLNELWEQGFGAAGKLSTL